MGRRASLGLGIGAFAAVAAHELHAVKRAALRHSASPYSGPLSVKRVSVTYVAPHADNSTAPGGFVGDALVEADLSDDGEIRGLRRIT